jgi:hypothetical protein
MEFLIFRVLFLTVTTFLLITRQDCPYTMSKIVDVMLCLCMQAIWSKLLRLKQLMRQAA